MLAPQEISRRLKALALPVTDIVGEVRLALDRRGGAVVTAPPGAGKSTVLPLSLLADGTSGRGKILMLEARRLAARSIAERMAATLGEKPGQTVGYRIKGEKCVSKDSRIEVLTERILTRMLIADPSLEGVDTVIFDEFHERSLDADTALALALEGRRLFREDLRIVVMSATIDAAAICQRINAPLIESKGRMFPVEIVHSPTDIQEPDVPDAVVRTIRSITLPTPSAAHCGSILAFLPGEAEIRRCAQALCGCPEGGPAAMRDGVPTRVYPLYGLLGREEQRRAIAPCPDSERKIVLATPIAETSLTIDGVTVVIDSGFCRRPVFNPQTTLSSLQTVRISMDMARQRTGRAGRTAPGICYRLWSKALETRLKDCRAPEILDADLAGMVLDCAAWGENRPLELPWMTPPPAKALERASTLLVALGALDSPREDGSNGAITSKGRELDGYPFHPRIANMMHLAGDISSGGGHIGARALAEDIAEILENRDPRPGAGADICLRLSAHTDPYTAGALIASAFPERIAGCFSGGTYLFAGGEKGFIDPSDSLYGNDYLAVASAGVSASGSAGRIFLAAPLAQEDLEKHATVRRRIEWDRAAGGVVATQEWRIGRLVVKSKPLGDVTRDQIISAVCAAAPKDGESIFDFNDGVDSLMRRISAAASWHPEAGFPCITRSSLLDSAAQWLPMYTGNASSAAALKKIDLREVILGLLPYPLRQELDRIAPEALVVPSGNRIRLEYRSGTTAPVLRVRLQECFGLEDTPTVDNGRVKVLMELLSPGFKPVQLTSDLRSFWHNTYFEVRKELRLRYPKHAWPEAPLEALPSTYRRR